MRKYAVVGLGYVGLGLLVALSKKFTIIGCDNNQQRIEELRAFHDRNHLLSKAELSHKNISFTENIKEIQDANFYIVSVSTPAYDYEIPNLEPLIAATKDLSGILKKDDIVVFESTVYPGTTENVCIPVLEEGSGLKHGRDFHVGYSPERINPGDAQHTLKNITKIISADNKMTLNAMEETYKSICDTVYPVSSMACAEATKLLENTQRDVNIALMNEFTQIMHALNLNMHEIIEAAKTKWGFAPYKPGFVGGHCISIDPYYLAFEAKRHGVQPELILTARRVNNTMTGFVVQSLIKLILQHNVDRNHLKIGLFGLSYKENVLDLRNSLAIKLWKELKTYSFDCVVHDPLATEDISGIPLTQIEKIKDLSVAIIIVGHDYYKKMGLQNMMNQCKKPAIVMDIPNLFIAEKSLHEAMVYWSL